MWWRISFVAIMCGMMTDSGNAAAPTSIIRSWFPIEVGDRWIYQHEQFDAGPHGLADPMIERWKTEETIDSVTDVPEGTLVSKRVRGYDHQMLSGWLKDNDSVARLHAVERILIRRNCIFQMTIETACTGSENCATTARYGRGRSPHRAAGLRREGDRHREVTKNPIDGSRQD